MSSTPTARSAPRKRAPTTAKAFLFSDLRSYTAFVERYGDAAAAALLREYRDLVRREVGRLRGAEVKTEGDSFYVVFDSASVAVECAVAIQRGVRGHNAASAEAELRVGIGVHVGETIAFDHQYVGSAVNIASRLAGKAEADEILISDTLRGLIRTGVSLPLLDRGQLELKGVSEPIRAWSVEWRSGIVEEPDVIAPRTFGFPRHGRLAIAASGFALILVGSTAAYVSSFLAPRPAASVEAWLPPHGPLLFELDRAPGGSRRVVVARGDIVRDVVRFLGDAVEISVSPASHVALTITDLAPDDFVAEYTAAVASGQGTHALWFRGAQSRQLQVQLTPQTGEVLVQVSRSVEERAPEDRLFGPASRLPPARGAEQRIVVGAGSRDVVVYEGGREIARAIDPLPSPGGVGILVRAAPDRAFVVRLTALRVYAP